MKTWINVAVGVFFLSSVWKECLSHLLQEEVSDLASLQDVNAIERTDDLHGLVLIEERYFVIHVEEYQSINTAHSSLRAALTQLYSHTARRFAKLF